MNFGGNKLSSTFLKLLLGNNFFFLTKASKIELQLVDFQRNALNYTILRFSYPLIANIMRLLLLK